jgi:hypothetical protein
MVTYNEYSMPVLDGAALELVDFEIEVDLVEVEVASVVDGFTEVVDDEASVELGFDVSVPGTHWPEIISEGFVGCRRTYYSMCSELGTRSLTHMKSSPSTLNLVSICYDGKQSNALVPVPPHCPQAGCCPRTSDGTLVAATNTADVSLIARFSPKILFFSAKL